MGNKIVKDPTFPMKHVQVTDLKNTVRIAEMAKDADVLVTRNGETVAYLVSPEHYEALVDRDRQNRAAVTAAFLESYKAQHGSLDRLDEAVAASRRGSWATPEEEAEVFGD